MDISLSYGYENNSRGIGVADMAEAILKGGEYRPNGQLAYHVLEAMHGFHDASDSGNYYHMESTCKKPAPLAKAIL